MKFVKESKYEINEVVVGVGRDGVGRGGGGSTAESWLTVRNTDRLS